MREIASDKGGAKDAFKHGAKGHSQRSKDRNQHVVGEEEVWIQPSGFELSKMQEKAGGGR